MAISGRVLDEGRAAALIADLSLASLAACDGERLDNAVICVASEGLRLYFGAFETTLKAVLMQARPRVALTLGPLQYHGAVRILERGSREYGAARAVYDRKFPQYASLFEEEGNELFEITPLALWLYEASHGALDRALLAADEAYCRSLALDADPASLLALPSAQGREIEYGELEEEARLLAGTMSVAVLATGGRGRVSARSISFVWSGLEAWFQTSALSEKWAQLVECPVVAICAGSVQIEGLAEPRGVASEAANEWFRSTYSRIHAGSFELYGSLEEERVVSVRPTRVKIWKYESGRPRLDILDPASRRAWRTEP